MRTTPAHGLLWLAACVAVVPAALLAVSLPPSATFLNQAAALSGWGVMGAALALGLHHSTDASARLALPPINRGLAALLAALGLLAAACVGSWAGNGLPLSITASNLAFVAAAALALLLVPATWWVLYRTRFGLRLRAVGENPASVDTAGVSVVRLRYTAVLITGVLCGLAGAYMATGLQAGFGREMTAGRGYIALAALIFAKWRPWYCLYATLLFGFLQALALRPDVIENIAGVNVPIPALDALPYILTVVVLAGLVGKATPPRAGGEAYVKER